MLCAPCARLLFPGTVVLPSLDHVSCQLLQLSEALHRTKENAQVLLVYCNMEASCPIDIPSEFNDTPRVRLTVLTIGRSRFPAFLLSQLTELFTAVDGWYRRRISDNHRKLVIFVGIEGPSKALFLGLAFRIWEAPEVSLDDQLMECFTQKQLREEPPSFLRAPELIVQELHVVPPITPQTFFPSQLRILQFWQNLCASVCREQQTGPLYVEARKLLRLSVRMPFETDTAPVVEVWPSDRSVYTTDLWSTKSYQALRGGNVSVIPLRFQSQIDSTETWEITLINSPRIVSDVLLRILPPARQQQEAEHPKWMFRVQWHMVMFSEAVRQERPRMPNSELPNCHEQAVSRGEQSVSGSEEGQPTGVSVSGKMRPLSVSEGEQPVSALREKFLGSVIVETKHVSVSEVKQPVSVSRQSSVSEEGKDFRVWFRNEEIDGFDLEAAHESKSLEICVVLQAQGDTANDVSLSAEDFRKALGASLAVRSIG
eukprot:Gregarina_sp_Poly_1__4331@NODE_234_length_11010_cov_523_298456_g207_i0_p4_GENE_NODE_234_length_11010_cov_523_298456_g207_i0NODE_234_length_11010_cov_523_298456_g207_i0_p4_ORF_typecomplete_len484_score59_07_NODE_234_length_11010_cov_523_298456_g207_i0938910840